MANHTGSEGTVKIGANAVAEVTGWSLSHRANTIDDSELSDAAETHKLGRTSWDGSVDCHWDETDTTGQGALTVGASVTLNLYPEGATSGDTYYTGTATVTQIERSASIDSIVSAKFSFKGTGVLSSSTAV